MGNFWKKSQTTIPIIDGYFEIIFEGVLVFNNGDISIDDVLFSPGGTCLELSLTTQQPTTTGEKPLVALQCDFEIDFCDWLFYDEVSNFRWRRQVGQAASYGAAPVIDHTLENQYGVYILANSNDQPGSAARLRSPELQWSQETCIEFWYQLSGPSAPSLSVTLRNNTGRQDIWKRSGNVADEWKHVYVRIPPDRNRYWIDLEGIYLKDKFNSQITKILNQTFLATISVQYKGYAAIDDVQLILDRCPSERLCDFESPNICGFENDLNADFKWNRLSGDTMFSFDSVIFDHTYQTGQGFFMLSENLSQTPGKKARLISSIYKKNDGGTCLTWWYR